MICGGLVGFMFACYIFSTLLFLLHIMQNDPSEAWRLTSFSRCILNLGLAFTIMLICEKLELNSMVVREAW